MSLYVASADFRRPSTTTKRQAAASLSSGFISSVTFTIECDGPNQAIEITKEFLKRCFVGVEVIRLVVH